MKKQVHNVTTGEITMVDLTAEEEAAVTKNIEDAAKVQYKFKRRQQYPTIADQLDKIYHSGIDAWKADIKKVKDDNPKP